MYKYTKKKYGDLLLLEGSLKIGTLHDFRRIEHGAGIADPHEGKKWVRHELNVHRGPDDGPVYDSEAFGIVMEKNSSMQGMTVVKAFDDPNVYILCLSTKCAAATMAEFEGANDCINVRATSAFFKILTELISQHTPVFFAGCFAVKYSDRDRPWNRKDWGTAATLVKGKEFKAQLEVRAVWAPYDEKTEINPIVVSDPRIGKFFRRVRVV